MKKVRVEGLQKKYTAYIKNGAFEQIDSLIGSYNYKNVFVINDVNVNVSSLINLKIAEKVLELDVSEKIKNFSGVGPVLNFLYENDVYRNNTLVVAVGGGALLDLVGFVCSIYMRGIDVAYVPTSLMAMLDVAIGSKNAIDYKERKNLLGTFYDPVFSLVDPLFLKTLPYREIKSGLVEAIKIAYIANDKVLMLMDNVFDKMYNWEPLIYLCLNIKNELIEKDFEDNGVRKFLNFGHTFGHALEAYYNYDKYTHGEAVALGMCLVYPSKRLIRDLRRIDVSTEMDYFIDYKRMFELMKHDKKRSSSKSVSIVTLEKEQVPVFDEMETEYDLFKKIERLKLINEEISEE